MRLTKCVLFLGLIIAGACKDRLAMKFKALGYDTVNVSGIGTGRAIVIANGHRADVQPCARGYILSAASPSAQFENLLTAPPCEADVAAFAKGRGMGYENASQKWTDRPGDQVAIVLASRLSVIPLNIFILSGDEYAAEGTDPIASRISSANEDLNRAVQLYDDYMTGISFSVTNQIFDETQRGNFTSDLLTADCTNVGPFLAVDRERTAIKGINVFYSDGQAGLLGKTCHDSSNFGSIVIVISQGATGDVLAHEFGHALSLDHYNQYGVPIDNLMMSPTSFPTSLTIGQAFRMNVNALSVLNTGAYRTGTTKTCPDPAGPPASPECADITLRP